MSTASQPRRQIQAPISVGELIDKITILEIKAAHLRDPERSRNVATELQLLEETRAQAGLDNSAMKPFAADLKAINAALWRIEDDIRACEANADFGPRFIELARSVYLTNDRRAALKREIDIAFGSTIVGEKAHSDHA